MGLDFEHLLGLHTGERRDYLPICQIDPLVAAAIGATTQTVFLSAHTIRKQLKRHQELPISTYRIVRPCLAFGEPNCGRALRRYCSDKPLLSRLHQSDRCRTRVIPAVVLAGAGESL
jgi:hypothetical protein